MIAVPGLGVRSDFPPGEVAHDGTELLLFRRGVEVHDRDGTRSSTVPAVDQRPGDAVVRPPLADSPLAYAIMRDGDRWLVCERATQVITARGPDMFSALDEISRDGFWVGFVTYEAGRNIERIEPRIVDDLGLPDLAFVRFDDVRVVNELPQQAETSAHTDADEPSWALGVGESTMSSIEHASLVARIQALLGAGECYQVNLTRRISFDTAPDPRSLFLSLTRLNPAPHAGMCAFGAELAGLAVVSASPELFLRVDGRAVETRPIKGTAADVATLRASTKDRAENLMIVDLARNDLGRVCEYGSVDVPSLFAIEEHPGLTHLVSAVRGRLRPEIGLADLLRATFPPASVTGAPKPRVLQAIEDLETVPRGVYCGAFGWIDGARERASLSVAIRTFTITGGRTHLGVGGGIVADSCADAEWAETELKSARLLRAAGARTGRAVRVR